ncbi:MAG: M23 family metallopeptidase [Candidatus Moranbacteria bacterium]|nr:M23 family metallopeptidase [Candidatus Moranbacteria bacterium]
MRNIIAALALLVCFFQPAFAAFDWSSFTALPRTIPFVENGVTYTAFVQTRHPWYTQNYIVYYPAGISADLKPVAVDYNQGPPYQHLWILLNPLSQSQAFDSYDYNPNVIIYNCYGNTACQNDTWGNPVSINQSRFRSYTWFDWTVAGPTGYDLRNDLVRAVGIDIKVNFTYNWNGQFGLPSLAAGDALVTGSSLFKWPLSGTFASRTQTKTFGANWVLDCPSGTPKKHGGLDVNATYGEDVYAAHAGTVKDINYDAGWEYGIVIEDTTGQYTTVYWHVNAYGGLAVNDTVTKGQKIATVANLGGNTHFHFGIRSGAYNASLSLAGALPVASCGSNPVYPAFPENLIDPAVISY